MILKVNKNVKLEFKEFYAMRILFIYFSIFKTILQGSSHTTLIR